MLINARFLKKPFANVHLEADLRSLNINSCAMTETWHSDEVATSLVSIPNFNLYRKDERIAAKPILTNVNLDGVAMYVSLNFAVDVISPVTSRLFEILWFRIHIKSHCFIFVTLYCSQQSFSLLKKLPCYIRWYSMASGDIAWLRNQVKSFHVKLEAACSLRNKRRRKENRNGAQPLMRDK